MTDKRKSGSYAKAKGSGFENDTAKAFSAWFNETAKTPLNKAFYRVPSSGSLEWATSMNVDGDVTADPKISFNYLIECKKVEGWTVDNILKGNTYFPLWLAQSVREGLNINKVPLLIFSRVRVKPMVMAPYNYRLTKLIDPYIVKKITYKSELTGKRETMKTLTFMQEDFLKIPFDTANHLYDEVDWTKQVTKLKSSVKPKETKKPDTVADDVLHRLMKL